MPKVDIVVDGELREVEVDLAGGFATVGTLRIPVHVRSDGATAIELEVGGERMVVSDWPDDAPGPRSTVSVEGERFAVLVRASRWSAAPVPMVPSTPTSTPISSPATDDPTAIAPPMPGRVIEVRVHEGEHVRTGAVLVVVEAMKMRNEVASPRSGTVRDLRVRAGSAVKARQPMLRIEPD